MEENPKSPDGQAASGSEPEQEQDKTVFHETEAKKAYKARDEKAARVRELEEKLKGLEEAEEIRKGNLEKVIADKNQENEQLKAETERLKQIEEKFASFEKAQRSELLAELSDEHKAIAGDLELDKLREYVKLNKSATPGMNTARAGGQGTLEIAGKKWFDFTSSELTELKKSAPKVYEQLKKTI